MTLVVAAVVSVLVMAALTLAALGRIAQASEQAVAAAEAAALGGRSGDVRAARFGGHSRIGGCGNRPSEWGGTRQLRLPKGRFVGRPSRSGGRDVSGGSSRPRCFRGETLGPSRVRTGRAPGIGLPSPRPRRQRTAGSLRSRSRGEATKDHDQPSDRVGGRRSALVCRLHEISGRGHPRTRTARVACRIPSCRRMDRRCTRRQTSDSDRHVHDRGRIRVRGRPTSWIQPRPSIGSNMGMGSPRR